MAILPKSIQRGLSALVLTALVAACGAGSESSDTTTERTRNSALWTPSTEPTKVVVYGTQDGRVEYLAVPSTSGSVSPTRLADVDPNKSWWNAVTGVAVDTARSEVIFSGLNKDSRLYLTKVNADGSGRSNIFETESSFVYGMGYDPSTRIAAIDHILTGSVRYVVHSVDEVEAPIVDDSIGFYTIPVISGTDAIVTSGAFFRNVSSTNPRTVYSESASLATTPFDMWAFAKDPNSESIYGGRQSVGELVRTTLGAGSTMTTVRSLTSPASLAAFSDGSLAVGGGQVVNAGTPTRGTLTIVDPSGAAADIEISGVDSGEVASGLQSVWAVESPIAETAAEIDGDTAFGSTLSCEDAQWREDLPLSRLSRSPIEGVRTFSWFLNGTQIEGETSNTFVSSAYGSYQCAVTAGNLAGTGQSKMSEPLVIAEDADSEVTTTTLASGGESSATPDESPSVTTPAAPGVSPGTDTPATPIASPIVTIPVAAPTAPVVVVTPTLRSAKWTFKGRTAKVTFRKYAGAKRYRLSVTGATQRNFTCRSGKTTVTCTTTTLKKGINSFSARALGTSGITLALTTKTRLLK